MSNFGSSGSKNKVEGDAWLPPIRRREETYQEFKTRLKWWTKGCSAPPERWAPLVIQHSFQYYPGDKDRLSKLDPDRFDMSKMVECGLIAEGSFSGWWLTWVFVMRLLSVWINLRVKPAI